MYINRSKQAAALSRRLWDEFRQYGYPAKVGVNVAGLTRVLDAQCGKCYDCGEELGMICWARQQYSERTCKILCEKCYVRPKN